MPLPTNHGLAVFNSPLYPPGFLFKVTTTVDFPAHDRRGGRLPAVPSPISCRAKARAAGPVPKTNFAALRCSTSEPAERDRVHFWREFFTCKIVLGDVEPQSDLPFHAEAALPAWPGPARCGSASPCQCAAGSLSRGIRKVVGERSECLKDFLCMSTALHSLNQLVVEALVRQENGTFGLHSSNRRVDIS